MFDLKDKSAIVLGASSKGGIGEAIARAFSSQGANVTVSGRKIAPLKSLAKDIGGTAQSCDVTSEADIEGLFAKVKDSYGKVDIAVNAAGINRPEPISALTQESLRNMCEVQLVGPTLFIKHAAAAMPTGGSIITLSSVTAELTGPSLGAYAATKAAVDKIVRVAAVEYGSQGVRVNSLSPSLTQTPMTEKIFQTQSMIKAFEKETPLGRMVTADDVAFAALYLASDHCVATGDNIRVSGGAHLRRLPTYAEMMSDG